MKRSMASIRELSPTDFDLFLGESEAAKTKEQAVNAPSTSSLKNDPIEDCHESMDSGQLIRGVTKVDRMYMSFHVSVFRRVSAIDQAPKKVLKENNLELKSSSDWDDRERLIRKNYPFHRYQRHM